MAVGDGVEEAVEQLINTASALGSTTIDLSKKRLTRIPPEVLNLQQLEVTFAATLVCRDRTSIGCLTVHCLPKRTQTLMPLINSNVSCFYSFQFLYLEGNAISSFPEELFDCLPNLRWLDLRNNRISEIPPIIGKHRFDI